MKSSFAFLLVLASLATGCHTPATVPPLNLAEPDWQVLHGQAVWRPSRAAKEIAGELFIATHPDGRSLVQFTKTPLLLVSAQTSAKRWRVQFPREKVFEGGGAAPTRVVWLHLAKVIAGVPPPSRLTWEPHQDGTWKLENDRTGEMLEGFVAP
ncbi:MAG: hypothetical protein EXS31_17415 [Pedosphaera sp.]|nr:hypothetical protein [Pedosphaera sp.]